jgi:hypothetical protein
VQVLDIDIWDECDPVIGVGDVTPAPARALAVSDAFPNPFNPRVNLTFVLAEAGSATVRVYDIAGRAVRELLTGPFAAGEHRVAWDGLDVAGNAAASGIYFIEVQAASQRVVRKVALIE